MASSVAAVGALPAIAAVENVIAMINLPVINVKIICRPGLVSRPYFCYNER
jgi:hypothetical protein